MDKISKMEITFIQQTGGYRKFESVPIEHIKNQIKDMIKPSTSITIDEIYEKKFKNINWEYFERAINDLIDEEILDISEGESKMKINGYIGRIIRR